MNSYRPVSSRSYRPAVETKETSQDSRIIWLRIIYVLIGIVFVARLFYVQVWRHSYYRQLALESQLKRFVLPADRGRIYALGGSEPVPLVLNEERYTVFADPIAIKDLSATAKEVSSLLSLNRDTTEKSMSKTDTRYVVLKKSVEKTTIEQLVSKKLAGIGYERTPLRSYPQGSLAAQILGFVNNDGQGQYGVEGYLDESLRGQDGVQKAITDGRGVPLANNPINESREPVAGKDLVLTVDVAMQRKLEDIVKRGIENAKSDSGSALVMETRTGAIKAMASFPSYDPAKFQEVSDAGLFLNPSISRPLEPGSIMKTLTVAAALNEGAVGRESTYYDPNQIVIGDSTIKNAISYGAAQRSITEILQKSLNTGVVTLLKSFGNGEINEKARTTWHNYLVDRYRFGSLTGIEQSGEEPGYVPLPNEGFGLEITYANTAFGQALNVSLVQMAAAYSAAINGGTYYRPTLIAGWKDGDGTLSPVSPTVVEKGVVSESASNDLREILTRVIASNNPKAARVGYQVGGKTGTAQITRPEGGYFDDRYNGTYLGFVGGDLPEYTIIVRVNEPKIPGFAGTVAAAPIFTEMSNALIDTFNVRPKSTQ